MRKYGSHDELLRCDCRLCLCFSPVCRFGRIRDTFSHLTSEIGPFGAGGFGPFGFGGASAEDIFSEFSDFFTRGGGRGASQRARGDDIHVRRMT